jgi:HSP20 family protein
VRPEVRQRGQERRGVVVHQGRVELRERCAGRGGEAGEGADLSGDAAQARGVAAGPCGRRTVGGATVTGGLDALSAGASGRSRAVAQAGDEYVVAFDLPGVSADAIDIDVERNMLTVRAERRPLAGTENVQMELSERPLGAFCCQIVLADTLDTERIKADYDAGVLTLRIPIAERAKPRKIAVGGDSGHRELSG